ncbi:MAG: 50S ribosomal protein L7Ae-like protein [Firmicutes bacterium]|nr:50S ribosomal protein L7Ae-like protein [Bacillota bacterium]
MVERLKSAKKKTVGTKQTIKAVEKGEAKVVFIARDAEKHIVAPLEKLCSERAIEVVYIDSMKQLGEICGIEVGAASAAIL